MTTMAKTQEKAALLNKGRRVAFAAAFVTFALAVMKWVVGTLSGSEVLLADAIHSGADLLAIFASGFGLWLASRQKSAKFPYGLYKAETMASLLIGGGIAWAGIDIFLEGYRALFVVPAHERFPFVPVIASAVSIAVAVVLARKEKKVGTVVNSRSLILNAGESLLDVFVSGAVLLGILLAHARIPYVEGAIIMGIALLLLKLALQNMWISLLVLMDANLDPELQREIEEKVNSIYGVKAVGDIRIRQSGPFKMVECKLETSPTLPLYKAHELADKVEEFIMRTCAHVESVFIHLEPAHEDVVSAIIPVKEIRGLDSKVHGHFGRSPYYIILKIRKQGAEIVDFYSNPFLEEKRHIGIKVIKGVIGYKLDLLFTSRIGEISFHMLRDNFVDMYRIEEGERVGDVIEKYRSGKLEKITEPTHPLEDSQVEKG
jgi:cation diffusion facilitator family transporter